MTQCNVQCTHHDGWRRIVTLNDNKRGLTSHKWASLSSWCVFWWCRFHNVIELVDCSVVRRSTSSNYEWSWLYVDDKGTKANWGLKYKQYHSNTTINLITNKRSSVWRQLWPIGMRFLLIGHFMMMVRRASEQKSEEQRILKNIEEIFFEAKIISSRRRKYLRREVFFFAAKMRRFFFFAAKKISSPRRFANIIIAKNVLAIISEKIIFVTNNLQKCHFAKFCGIFQKVRKCRHHIIDASQCSFTNLREHSFHL